MQLLFSFDHRLFEINGCKSFNNYNILHAIDPVNEERLNAVQIRYIKLIVDYIIANGMIEDRRVLMEEPFRTVGSIIDIFKDNMADAQEIMKIVVQIK